MNLAECPELNRSSVSESLYSILMSVLQFPLPLLQPHTEAYTLPCSNLITFPGSQDFPVLSIFSKTLFPNLQVATAFQPEQLDHNTLAFLYPLKDLFSNRHPW